VWPVTDQSVGTLDAARGNNATAARDDGDPHSAVHHGRPHLCRAELSDIDVCSGSNDRFGDENLMTSDRLRMLLLIGGGLVVLLVLICGMAGAGRGPVGRV